MHNLEPTVIHNSGSVPVEMEACEDVQFKQLVIIEFLTTAKIGPVDIHRRMQAVCEDKCVDVSTVIRWVRHFKEEEGGDVSLCDKEVSGRPGQNSETC